VIKNVLKLDPTRTTMLRRKYVADTRKRFAKIAAEVTKLLVADDAFGLVTNAVRQFAFLTDDRKVAEFERWLQKQIDAGILVRYGDKYVESAYKKGMTRAYVDSHGEQLQGYTRFYRGTKEDFLRSAFNQPESIAKAKLLYTRSYSDLKGVTDAMSQKLSRTLANGLIDGSAPSKIARDMVDQIGSLSRTRAEAIARTEIISAHAEGQLDAFDELGIENVSAEAEWSTAGDDRVCDDCANMEGTVMTTDEARGQIPLHPNCRCSWIPVVETIREKEVA